MPRQGVGPERILGKEDAGDNKSITKDDHSDTHNSVKKVLTAIKNV